MTTEDDFQRAIDATPNDRMLRLVFADWLQERGDPRSDGYRALGTLTVWPMAFAVGAAQGFLWFASASEYPRASNALPEPWFLAASGQVTAEYPNDMWPRHSQENHCRYRSRRRLENAVAVAWLAVAEADRKKILADAERSS